MDPLLKITTIPIAYELRIQPAQLEHHNGTAELEISRQNGGLKIKSRPIKLNIDSFEARSSVTPTPAQNSKTFADKGKSKAYEATAQFAKEGQLMLKAKIGEDITGQIISQKSQPKTGEFGMAFIPTSAPEMTWSDPDLIIQYQMDKLNFDWRLENTSFEFTPGDIQIHITQQPDILIEYMGDPIYVPPSASPNYEGIDLRA